MTQRDNIIEAAELIREFTAGKAQDDFMTDRLLQNGIIRLLIVVGEAVTQLSREFCDTYADIPWRTISNFRHRLVHDYSGIDMDIVWEASTIYVPELHAKLTEILAEGFSRA